MHHIETPSDFGKALKRGAYAWPGGYPVFFVTSDGQALSFKAAKTNGKLVCDAIREKSCDDWRVIAADINWENPSLYCDHTGNRIESAYAEDEALKSCPKTPAS